MENLKEPASAGGENDEDDGLVIELDFTQALYDYWESQKKEESSEV